MRRELARRRARPAASAPRLPDVARLGAEVAAQAATFAACPPAPTRVVAGRSSPGNERAVEADDDVEDQVAERGETHA